MVVGQQWVRVNYETKYALYPIESAALQAINYRDYVFLSARVLIKLAFQLFFLRVFSLSVLILHYTVALLIL